MVFKPRQTTILVMMIFDLFDSSAEISGKEKQKQMLLKESIKDNTIKIKDNRRIMREILMATITLNFIGIIGIHPNLIESIIKSGF